VIAAVAAAVALAEPSREALIERWLRANRTHSAARLQSGPSASPAQRVPDLRALAERELATAGRYRLTQTLAPPASEPWWARVWDWVADRWQRFWNALFSRVHVGREAAASIGDVLLAIVGLVLLVVTVRLLMNLQLARTQTRARSEPFAAPPDPRSLYRDACAAAGRGQYGDAALLLFAATVALLDSRGDVEAKRSATVGDLRRGLRASDAALVAPFDTVAAPFVQRAYAERTIDAPQWQAARTAFESICHPEPVEG
jgi:hypothetical protein